MPAYGYSSQDLKFLDKTGVDPHEITTGKTQWGVCFATLGHYRVIYHPVEGGSEALINVDGIGWVVDTEPEDMPPMIYEALLEACKTL